MAVIDEGVYDIYSSRFTDVLKLVTVAMLPSKSISTLNPWDSI